MGNSGIRYLAQHPQNRSGDAPHECARGHAKKTEGNGMNRYRIEFTEHEDGVPIRFAITFQSESKETAKAFLSDRHPLAWDAVITEVMA